MSFGERLSSRVFASFLRSQGIAAAQHDAFAIGMTTTDDFQNAEVIYNETLPALKASLARPPGAPKTIPVVTGFLGRGINTGRSPLPRVGETVFSCVSAFSCLMVILGAAV